jgi:polyisoprenoid-binding protein YceI
MKKLLATTAVILTSFSAITANAADVYNIDPTHANIDWRANHFGFSNPSGKFTKTTGTITIDEKNPEKSSVDVTIETDGIVTGIEKFDAHLKNADFFNVEKFPKATFKSTKVVKTGDETVNVTGDLTILGKTNPVTLEAKLNKKGENPFSKKQTVGFSATAVIKRSEWGMNYAVPGVSDEVQLVIEVEAALAD